ncbi:MAG TPA: hypothetical protein VFK85_02615 [Anaeromyxobacteraceae bacterium]|nr:hypothetical protein [Anaeromyxobacteraceae bacterium]
MPRLRPLAAAAVLAFALVPAAALAQSRPARQQASYTLGARLGGFAGVNYAAPDSPSGIGAGVVWTFDIPGLLADVSFDAMFGESRARLVWGGFGAYYPLTEDETTPYLGGGLKVGWARFGGDGAVGLMPFGSIGLLIGRSWSPHIRLDISLFGSTGSERQTPESPSKHPVGAVATFGMGF